MNWSYFESKTKACNELELSPEGGGILLIICSIKFSTPSPVLAETFNISFSLKPRDELISLITLSTWAFGESILFSTGIITTSCSIARYTLAKVCAWMPCVQSINNKAPSHAARDLDTS